MTSRKSELRKIWVEHENSSNKKKNTANTLALWFLKELLRILEKWTFNYHNNKNLDKNVN